jgi:hypothetical protein
MTPLLVIIHSVAAVTLIVFVLLHAGRGGGVSEMFGGGMQTQAMGSTVMDHGHRCDRVRGHDDPARDATVRIAPRLIR